MDAASELYWDHVGGKDGGKSNGSKPSTSEEEEEEHIDYGTYGDEQSISRSVTGHSCYCAQTCTYVVFSYPFHAHSWLFAYIFVSVADRTLAPAARIIPKKSPMKRTFVQTTISRWRRGPKEQKTYSEDKMHVSAFSTPPQNKFFEVWVDSSICRAVQISEYFEVVLLERTD